MAYVISYVRQCQILRLKCTKFDFRWGSAADPAEGAYREGEGKGREGGWRERRGGRDKGKGGEGPVKSVKPRARKVAIVRPCLRKMAIQGHSRSLHFGVSGKATRD